MKTVIYYFTGTGNSLAAAKKVAGPLGDTEFVPIAAFRNTTDEIIPDADRVGIVCPVYFSGLPAMAASFAERLDVAKADYVFSVVTHGGGGGSAALRQIDEILKERAGRGLDAGFAVTMPGNYILMYGSPAGKKRDRLLAAADAELDAIAGRIRRGERVNLPYAPLTRLIRAVMYPRFRSRVHGEDRRFTVTEECTSCGICASICPAENIEMVDGRPVWNHRCELCCGCIHLCPAGAIQAGKATEGRQRYRNPSVGIAELERRP
ncbi:MULTISPECIES: EFR1 family ferrodoxin [Methanoculleus]|uniref:4Fe-4S ferredoxin, iron-sulfur binding domain protein n=2 Tax=Methanoculleus TaxID=45989 RepID=A3CUF6_METMJ|nr:MULTISPECIES: EFR1 family ferrodoxin [Methanoculleus]ABN57006.1 4Fe-4S ferredoxin, iron-sulfur binding domain protein [Methanoculleus marisnigri JR1]MCC7555570.1 EFR1 family ferrodoxin [Methanoculleus marisnigri]UYU18425.1 EFR1 family ferrodoxin [Methanoculleus submarinus]